VTCVTKFVVKKLLVLDYPTMKTAVLTSFDSIPVRDGRQDTQFTANIHHTHA